MEQTVLLPSEIILQEILPWSDALTLAMWRMVSPCAHLVARVELMERAVRRRAANRALTCEVCQHAPWWWIEHPDWTCTCDHLRLEESEKRKDALTNLLWTRGSREQWIDLMDWSLRICRWSNWEDVQGLSIPEDLPWLVAHGFPLGEYFWKAVLSRQSWSGLQWLYDVRCPWSREVFWTAVHESPLFPNAARWLLKRGCPSRFSDIEKLYASGNDADCKWLRNRFPSSFMPARGHSSPATTTPYATLEDDGDDDGES